jgi:hypothetical protein
MCQNLKKNNSGAKRLTHKQSNVQPCIFTYCITKFVARGDAVRWGSALQAGWPRVRHNPSGRAIALGSTQPPTERSTGGICWMVVGGGKSTLCVGLTTLRPLYAECLQILGAPTSWSFRGLALLCRSDTHTHTHTHTHTVHSWLI